MGVQIDEAGKDGLARTIDGRRAVRIAPGGDRGDPAIDDADALVGQDLCSRRIDETTGTDVDGFGGCGAAQQQRHARDQEFPNGPLPLLGA